MHILGKLAKVEPAFSHFVRDLVHLVCVWADLLDKLKVRSDRLQGGLVPTLNLWTVRSRPIPKWIEELAMSTLVISLPHSQFLISYTFLVSWSYL